MKRKYSNFKFVGTLKFSKTLAEREVKEENGIRATKYGHYRTREKVVNGQIESNRIRANVRIEANGVNQMLDIEKFVKAGSTKYFYLSKEEKYTIDRAEEESIIQKANRGMVKNIKVGDLEFKTMSEDNFASWIINHHEQLNEKRLVLSGSVEFSDYNDGSVKYKVNNIREAYDNEVDGLELRLHMNYTKGSVVAPSFDDIKGNSTKKISVQPMVQINKNVGNDANGKAIWDNVLYKARELFLLDVDLLSFEEEGRSMYQSYTTALDFDSEGTPIKEMTIYTASFNGIIGSVDTKNATSDDLTYQEKLLVSMGNSLEAILAKRKVVNKTDNVIKLIPIPYEPKIEEEEHVVWTEQLQKEAQAKYKASVGANTQSATSHQDGAYANPPMGMTPPPTGMTPPPIMA